MKTAEHSQHKMGRGSGDGERRRLLEMARQLNATIGIEFFQALVKHLSLALNADCVYIAEFVGGQAERVRTLAAWVDRERATEFDFPLAGSPDSEVAVGRPCVFASNVQEMFPSDRRLAELKIEACVGVALNDSHAQACGIITALYRRPLREELRAAESMLALFTPRTSAELTRKQAEDSLRQSEQRYRAFIMLNTDAMWRIELEKPFATDLPEAEQLENFLRYGYVAECNDAAARLVGRQTAEQLIGASVRELGDLQQPGVDSLGSFIRSGYRLSTVETTPVDSAGHPAYRLRTQWGIVENGMLQRVWGTTRDITELKHYQMALVNSERRLTELLEAVHLVAIMLDHEGSISFCNDYFLKLTGWQADQISGKNWFDLMIPSDDREKMRAAFALTPSASQPPRHSEATLLTQNGRRLLIEWDTVILRDARGRAVGSAGIGRDVTEYRALEAQFRQAQKLESIGQLAGGVAHDFNNLLTIIRGYSALLLTGRKQTDPAYVGLLEITRAAEKGAALTRQLLAFSRRKVSQPKLLNLNTIIAEDERMLRGVIGEHIELTIDLDSSVGSVLVDAGDIHQVLLNLAVNARDAMPKGGKLIITLSDIDLDENRPSRLSAIEPGQYIHLIVADTGVGMSDEVRSHLFEPFFTTKDVGKGTGLGLSTVYGIIRQNGGHIQVETGPGAGTVFEIFLPRVPTPPPDPALEAVTARDVIGGTETILLVEDQRELRTLLASVLRRLGYAVLEAGSGRQGLRVMNRLSGPIHLLLTDIIMPGIMGNELAERVKAAHPETKVIYISGYSDLSSTPPFHDSGSVYLEKSFTPEELARTVRDTLDQQTV